MGIEVSRGVPRSGDVLVPVDTVEYFKVSVETLIDEESVGNPDSHTYDRRDKRGSSLGVFLGVCWGSLSEPRKPVPLGYRVSRCPSRARGPRM